MRSATVAICTFVVTMVLCIPAQAVTIGFNFTDNNSPTFSGQIGPALEPGIVGGANWNNVGPVGTGVTNRDMDADIISPTVDVIEDSTGAVVAGMAATYSYNNAFVAGAGTTGTDWDQMVESTLLGNNVKGIEASVTLTGIPYKVYDVYAFVAASADVTNLLSVTDGTETFYFRNRDMSAKTLITSTSSGSPTVDGNYAIFSSRTSNSITLTMDGSVSGVLSAELFGIHIVNTAAPEPTTFALAVMGLVGVVVCRRRRRRS